MPHTCHWPGCPITVQPKLWGCHTHWTMLPRPIRLEIQRSYRPGQEIDKRPSRRYVAAVQAAREWIARNG